VAGLPVGQQVHDPTRFGVFRPSPDLVRVSKYFERSRNFRPANGLDRAAASKAMNIFQQHPFQQPQQLSLMHYFENSWENFRFETFPKVIDG
jgi:hypothetical protein